MKTFNGRIGLLAAIALFITASASAAVTVTISPGYTNLGFGQTLQYTATVTGLPNTAVTWQVNGKTGGNATNGAITTGGLYTAPSAVPSNGPTITAIASDNKTSSTIYVNIEPPGPTITNVSPSPVSTGSYTVTITGTNFVKGGSILQNGAAGGYTFVNSTTITASGYVGTAGQIPFQVQNPGTLWGPVYNVTFVKSGPPPATTIAPTTVSVNLGATQQFTSNAATSWTASAGTISTTGLYTAPATMPSSKTVKVTATGAGGSASATVTLVNPNAQTIAPTSVSLNPGATQQFTGAGATSWTATYGTVDNTGFYTAPATMPAASTDTVTATGPNGNASATVTFIPPAPTVTGVNPSTLPLGIFAATVNGTGFISTSKATLNGTALSVTYVSPVQLSITGSAMQSGQANLVVINGSSQSAPFTVTVGISNPQVSSSAARRFLEQAAFGPSPADAATVQQLGFQGWLDQQETMAQVSNYNSITSSQGGLPQHFLTDAVMNPDQLRQRVGFALSQIFVVSIDKLIWNQLVGPYETLMMADAFGNYRTLLNDVTLSAGMGYYLDMGNNGAGNASGTILANENYAREVLQLFSIGTAMLNPDGATINDSTGNPLPTYDQPTIQQFAKAFTGWTYYPGPGAQPNWGASVDGTYAADGPMVAMAAFHDVTPKTLLNGQLLPGGQSAAVDLQQTLDNIFNHPNVGPFIGKQLIQHLVRSNPSPAYVARITAVFNNDGTGARGNLKAVVNAILLDPEARANDAGGNDLPGDGHLTEPALFIPALFRAFGGTMTDQSYFGYDMTNMSQDIYNAPSVFNYYRPGAEMQIFTPYTAIYRADVVASLFGSWSNPVANYGPGTNIDLSAYVPLAGNPAALVDALDLALTHGTMPASMKAAVVAGVTAEANGNVKKVETGIYLITSSGYYNVWH
jgi:uncharacterized protein (DUF1800 family)